MTAPRHFHQAVAAAKAGIGKGDSVTRPTADIVADLRGYGCNDDYAVSHEAADRLAELDDARRTAYDKGVDAAHADMRSIRPKCPTCDGSRLIPTGRTNRIGLSWQTSCHDCIDGHVSFAQLAATWRAVWDDANPIWQLGEFAHDIRDDLRAVKP